MNHSFNIENAKKYGVDCAIIIENMAFWIAKNKANKKHFYEGRTWTYNSVKAFSELFPYWNEKQISRILKKLEDEKIIISGNYNKSAYDRTKWYAFSDESIFLNPKIHLPKTGNGKTENGEPIPDINTDINPDINTEREERTHAEKKQNRKKSEKIETPYLDDMIEYCQEMGENRGIDPEQARQIAMNAYQYYEAGNWTDSRGKPVRNWKQKILAVWLKPEQARPEKKPDVNYGAEHPAEYYEKMWEGRTR